MDVSYDCGVRYQQATTVSSLQLRRFSKRHPAYRVAGPAGLPAHTAYNVWQLHTVVEGEVKAKSFAANSSVDDKGGKRLPILRQALPVWSCNAGKSLAN